MPAAEAWFEFKTSAGGFRYRQKRFTRHEAERLRRRWSNGTEIDWQKVPGLLAHEVVLDIEGLRDQHGNRLAADEDIRRYLLTELGGFQLAVLTRLEAEDEYRKNGQGGPVSSTDTIAPASSDSSPSATA